MKKWRDISGISEDEIVFSEDTLDYEKTINTNDSEFDEDTNFEEPFDSELDPDLDFEESLDFKIDEDLDFAELEEYLTWKKLQESDPEAPKIRVLDVAAYILQKMKSMTTMKLQKLVYYSQAWSLVWDEDPLFEENIEAWANGPVVRDLFDYHRGMYEISAMPIGNPRLLNQVQRETVDAVLEYYGDKSAQWLIELTHMEDPWIQARKGLPPLERGNRVISLDVIADYYSSLPTEEDFEDE